MGGREFIRNLPLWTPHEGQQVEIEDFAIADMDVDGVKYPVIYIEEYGQSAEWALLKLNGYGSRECVAFDEVTERFYKATANDDILMQYIIDEAGYRSDQYVTEHGPFNPGEMPTLDEIKWRV